MDSAGNSGSMQSSSTGGGDEAEYDSSSHAFFHVGGGGVSGSGGSNTMQQPSLRQQQSSLFDSLSNFLTNDNHNNNNPFSTRSNQNPSSTSLLNLDIPLQNPSSTIPRSQLNSFNSLMTSSPSPHLGRVYSQNPSLPMNNTDHQQANIQPNRNPKKRSRASRRAPTTVLTTDTSNFREMVQEFTGIPTQPFTSSSSLLFPRSNRLDLFSNSSSTSTVRSGGSDSSFLLRPFAHNPIQVSPFLSSASSSMLLNSNTSTSSSSTNSFQLLSDQLGIPSKNNQSLLNMQNNNPSLIPYQSLHLQSNSSRNENNDARTNISSSSGGVGLPNLVTTSDGLKINASSSWEDQDHLLRSLNNSRHHQQQQRVIMNADKGSSASNNQNVSSSARGEGMVDSWICSSE